MTYPTRIFRTAAAVALTGAALAACGSSSSSSTSSTTAAAATTTAAAKPAAAAAPVSSAKIAIRNYMYMPANLTVKVGAKVTFTNYDGTAHTATSEGAGFDTGTINPGHSATVTLTKAGTITYHCLFHAFMVAHITVVQ